jgi:hypothetical protein
MNERLIEFLKEWIKPKEKVKKSEPGEIENVSG